MFFNIYSALRKLLHAMTVYVIKVDFFVIGAVFILPLKYPKRFENYFSVAILQTELHRQTAQNCINRIYCLYYIDKYLLCIKTLTVKSG